MSMDITQYLDGHWPAYAELEFQHYPSGMTARFRLPSPEAVDNMLATLSALSVVAETCKLDLSAYLDRP